MKIIESSDRAMPGTLSTISAFDKIDQAIPILTLPNASHYHVKKSQLKIIQAIFHSQISLLDRFTLVKNKILYLKTQYFQ